MCVPYAALTAFCLRLAHDPEVNYKTQLVWQQLPVMSQMMIADALGLTRLPFELPWAVAYVLMVAPMLLALYLFGSVLENTFRDYRAISKGASKKDERGH
ncbi:hypothetical protein VC273_06905 [Xanthomonas nasturtii]|uniref:hypothetical protein n=1 Tax=Xanthomonas TaxID=338 RepID=UPI002B231A09|nr:hypothetical protein [Xanthomonas nasturtii]MEA9555657.1 hypothetical protein [Xanthomonas nasturtii]